jgi:hypothetical protein
MRQEKIMSYQAEFTIGKTKIYKNNPRFTYQIIGAESKESLLP